MTSQLERGGQEHCASRPKHEAGPGRVARRLLAVVFRGQQTQGFLPRAKVRLEIQEKNKSLLSELEKCMAFLGYSAFPPPQPLGPDSASSQVPAALVFPPALEGSVGPLWGKCVPNQATFSVSAPGMQEYPPHVSVTVPLVTHFLSLPPANICFPFLGFAPFTSSR